MKINLSSLKKTFSKLNYQWFQDRPTIIGIRSNLQVPDIFNDYLCLAFPQPEMPNGYSTLNKQKWLNKWAFKGLENKPLQEDGRMGKNTEKALQEYELYKLKGRLKIYVITTDPGVYYQNIRLLSSKGCAVMKPGQYTNAYQLGNHIRPGHKALIQTGAKITVFRDNDKDGIAENLGIEETGFFGCNIHGAQKLGKTNKIGAYSAGCQVFEDWSEKEEFIRICEQFKAITNNKFTYTLIQESDLLA